MNKKTAREYATQQALHFEKKAKHHKQESLWCFRLTMLSTLVAPILVALGEDVWFAKITPSVLTALAAFCTAWVQLRKPQELWAIYRNAQRQIEIETAHYDFQVGAYQNLSEKEADSLLVLKVIGLLSEVNKQWMGQVPNTKKSDEFNDLNKLK